MLYTQKASDRAEARGGSRAQVALAWLRPNPVVVAPLVPATKPSHLDDAMAWLKIAAADLRVDPHAVHRGGLLHEPFGQARSQCDLASARPWHRLRGLPGEHVSQWRQGGGRPGSLRSLPGYPGSRSRRPYPVTGSAMPISRSARQSEAC